MFRSDSPIVRYETIPPSHNCEAQASQVSSAGKGPDAAQLSHA